MGWREKPPVAVARPKGPPPPPQPYPRGGPSDAPKNPRPGLTAASGRPWGEYTVLFAGALLGSVIGSTAATVVVIWLMVM